MKKVKAKMVLFSRGRRASSYCCLKTLKNKIFDLILCSNLEKKKIITSDEPNWPMFL